MSDFNYNGETFLRDVITFLRAKAPELNFVITPEASDYLLPAVQVNSATLEDIFNAIRIVSKGEVQVLPESDTMVSFTLVSSESSKKYQKQCVAYNLSRYLQGKEQPEMDKAMRDLQQALELCWDMLAQANKTDFGRPVLRLHPATRLLIAVGQPDQLQVIDRIVRQLEDEGNGGSGGGYGMAPGIPNAMPLPMAPSRALRLPPGSARLAPPTPTPPAAPPVPPSTTPPETGK